MREIKFRYILQETWGDKKILTKIYTLEQIESGNTLLTHSLIKHLSRDEFTGQHDKNGKEIYEGDILAVAGKPIYQVVWSSHMAMFDLKKANGESAVDNFDLCEVIGDIYSNPELLEAGKS